MRILFTTFYDPNYLGIRILASVAKAAGHEVCICQLKDFRHRLLAPNDAGKHTGYFLFTRRKFVSSGDSEFPITERELSLFEQSIAEWRPDIIGFTLRSPYNHLLATVIPAMRRAAPQAFLVGGGFGPTFEPHISLQLGADAVIRGEGEGALLELAACLADDKDWRGIRNMAYLRDGEVVCNPLRPLIRDLDSQPFALYYGDHFISIDDDSVAYTDMRMRSLGATMYCTDYIILTGRGCIGKCSYCSGGHWRDQYRKQGLSAPPIRQRSLENVMQELHVAKEHGEKYIGFNDEYFVRPIDELCSFFQKYAEEIDLPFFAHLHHRQLMESNKLLQLVKQAGLDFIAIGVQSASEDFAKSIYYRKNNNRELLNCISLCQKNGFSGISHIIGANALETAEDTEALFDFCAHVPFDPSLKTDWHIHSAMLRLLEGSPLVKEHPELRDMTYSTAKYSEIMLLAELRNKVDAKTFAAIRENPFFKGQPDHLHFLLHQIIHDRHMQYLAKEIDRLEGQEVYFWGCGELYQYKHHLFHKTRPRCILVDRGAHPDMVDGLPVRHPDEVLLPEGEKLPIVMFTQRPNKICRTIARRYPEYTDTVACARL